MDAVFLTGLLTGVRVNEETGNLPSNHRYKPLRILSIQTIGIL